MHYSYHNRIKQRIQNDELIGFEFVDKYKKIEPALLLFFDTEPKVRPIREYQWEEYEDVWCDFTHTPSLQNSTPHPG